MTLMASGSIQRWKGPRLFSSFCFPTSCPGSALIVIHKSWQFSALTQCGALQIDADLVLTCRQGLQVRSMGNPDKPGKSAETESMAFALSDNLIIHKGFRLVYNDEGNALGVREFR